MTDTSSGQAHEQSADMARELERLLTLSRAQIDLACTDDHGRARLIELSLDEDLELREAAAAALDRDDEETAAHCEQEASAWRHTARLLREASTTTTPTVRSRSA